MTSERQTVPFLDLGIQERAIRRPVAAAWKRILENCSFVGGVEVTDFEQEFARYSGTANCVGVANGTDAIVLGLRALEIGPGDKVIVPANTFIATAEAVALVGAECIPVDCDPTYQLIDPLAVTLAAERFAPRAIIAVDLYGQIAPMDELSHIAAKYGAALIEDAAQSQGARRHDRGIGHGVALATTSFYPGKNLGAYGDGGAVLTNSDEIAQRVRMISNHGSLVRYQHEVIGMNSRLDTLQAVVLSEKLRNLDQWNDQRREAAQRYHELLDTQSHLVLPMELAGNQHVWHIYNVRVPAAIRDDVLRGLQHAGIGAAIHYPVPVHKAPAFRRVVPSPLHCDSAEEAASGTISLPMFPGITEAQQTQVAETLQQVMAHCLSGQFQRI